MIIIIRIIISILLLLLLLLLLLVVVVAPRCAAPAGSWRTARNLASYYVISSVYYVRYARSHSVVV